MSKFTKGAIESAVAMIEMGDEEISSWPEDHNCTREEYAEVATAVKLFLGEELKALGD